MGKGKKERKKNRKNGNKDKKRKDKKRRKEDDKKTKKPKKNKDEKKYVENPDKDKKPTANKELKINARLQKLGFTKIPKKSTLSKLECMWEEIQNLLLDCGEKMIANSP